MVNQGKSIHIMRRALLAPLAPVSKKYKGKFLCQQRFTVSSQKEHPMRIRCIANEHMPDAGHLMKKEMESMVVLSNTISLYGPVHSMEVAPNTVTDTHALLHRTKVPVPLGGKTVED